MPRIILYTGKGGVGKTSVSAASAMRIAESGLRTLILSTDPAHSLSDSFEVELKARPTLVRDNLHGQQIDAQEELEHNWKAVQQWLAKVVSERGVNEIVAEELTVPPGLDEFFALLQIKSHSQSDRWDVIVVDCAPTGETLKLLSFPEVAKWWLKKVLPWEKRLVSAARPFARGLLDVELPSGDVFSEVQQFVENLAEMSDILRDHQTTSVRLVMNPDRMVIQEAQRTFTYLNLYGYLTDAVIVNRIFPQEVQGSYFDQWRQTQQENTKLVRESFDPLPVLTAPYFEREVVGEEMLGRLSEQLFDGHDPAALLHSSLNQELSINNGFAELNLAMPFTKKEDVELKKTGAQLIVKVAGQKRNIMLPAALRAYRPTGAKFDPQSDNLRVTFEK